MVAVVGPSWALPVAVVAWAVQGGVAACAGASGPSARPASLSSDLQRGEGH